MVFFVWSFGRVALSLMNFSPTIHRFSAAFQAIVPRQNIIQKSLLTILPQ